MPSTKTLNAIHKISRSGAIDPFSFELYKSPPTRRCAQHKIDRKLDGTAD
jgi:hypothetical protein